MSVEAASRVCFTFGGVPASTIVDPGDPVTICTADCFGGRVTGPGTPPSQVCDLSQVNPVTGPYWVRGAEPGDTLAVHFVSITPAQDWAVSATFPHFGALTGSHDLPLLQPALPERVWRYELDLTAKTARFTASASEHEVMLPLSPMHGTVGVAPAGGLVTSTLTSGPHGGNLDTPVIRAGSTVYLGVNVPGAMFALGDGHARQGDGELCGVGLECAMTTTVVFELIKGEYTDWPRVETDTELICVGAGRPLDDAARRSAVEMVAWIRRLSGMDELDSLQLLSQISTVTVGNLCDPAYTVNTIVPKTLLPCPAEPYAATHQLLRARHLPGAPG